MLLRSLPEGAQVSTFEVVEAPSVDGTDVPADVMIMPLSKSGDGMIHARDGRKLKVDDAAALVARTNAEIERLGELPVDVNHEMFAWFGGDGEAKGWVPRVELRADGIYAVGVAWNEDGADLLRRQRYRYTSSVVRGPRVVLERDDWGWVLDSYTQADLIEGFAITNTPALEVRAMYSQDAPMKNAALLTLLGLGADATIEQATAAAEKLKRDHDAAITKLAAQPSAPSLSEHVPRAQFDALKKAHDEAVEKLRALEVDGALAKFNDRIAPAVRDYHRRQLMAGGADALREFEEYASKLPVIAGPLQRKPDPEATTLTAAERTVADRMGLTVEQFAAAKKSA